MASLICLTEGLMPKKVQAADLADGNELSVTCDAPTPFYRAGESAKINILIKNKTTATSSVKSLVIEISDFKGSVAHSADILKAPLKLDAKTGIYREATEWQIPADTAAGPYFIKITMETDDAKKDFSDIYYLKVLSPETASNPLKVYSIEKKNFKGIDVFLLDGGMSAEFAIEKSLTALSCGISHSWYPEHPGSGPRPVLASPDFLKSSLEKTIAYYDALGEKRVYDTVIIGTGVASTPYLARVTKAPVLPIHFLAAANSGREIAALLKTANADHSISSYAVLGYDFSMKDMAVAWIKLLDIPDIYLDFMKRHQVKNVLLIGTTGIIGETLARRFVTKDGDENSPISTNDIFLLYTSSSSTGYGYRPNMDINVVYKSVNYKFDMENFNKKLKDMQSLSLEKGFRRIADWESGISKEQIENYTKTLAQKAGVSRCALVTAAEDGDAVRHLYDFASCLMFSFYKKNSEPSDSSPKCEIKGIVMNPYLTSHPFCESACGYIPFLFWQGQKTDFLVKELGRLLKEIGHKPGQKGNAGMKIVVNISKNFNTWNTKPNDLRKILETKFPGIAVEIMDNSVDEAWNESDDKKSSCKKAAETLADIAEKSNLKKWEDSMRALSIDDILNIPKKYPKIIVKELINVDDASKK